MEYLITSGNMDLKKQVPFTLQNFNHSWVLQMQSSCEFLMPKITIYTSSHWALTNCTNVIPTALRPSNQVRKNLKNPNRETKKSQEEPQRRNPSSLYGQTCNWCHFTNVVRRHQARLACPNYKLYQQKKKL